jgi:Ca-activated chloride channel homolog
VTYGFPVPLQILGYLAAIAAGLVIVAYILKLRRRRQEIPFSKLWQRVLREKDASSLWRRLKRLFSLLIQLAFLALIVGAVTDPRVGEAVVTGRNIVVIVDSSASMKTRDEGPDKPARIERAKDEARNLLRRLGGADAAMVVRMDGQTTAMSRFESDVPHLVKVVDGIHASDTPADLHRALRAASDALRGRKDPMIVIIGDGAYSPDDTSRVSWTPIMASAAAPVTAAGTVPGSAPASTPGSAPVAPGPAKTDDSLGMIDLAGVDVRFTPVGHKDLRNVGIIAFNVRRYLANKLSYEVLVELQNFGEKQETIRVTLYSGDEPVDVKTLTIAGGERMRQIYPDLGGGDERALKMKLEPLDATTGQPNPDVFALDDIAHALLPVKRRDKVLLVTNDNLYLEAALLLDSNITVDKVKPVEYAAELTAGKLKGYDVVVFDSFTPDELPPSRSAIYFNPSGEKSPWKVARQIKKPILNDVEADHPTTRWVTLTDVNIALGSSFKLEPGDVALASAIHDPIIVAGRRDGRKVVAFGFGLEGTDLMMRVAFPILLVNSLDWFAGDDSELLTTFRTGQMWAIPVDSTDTMREVTVKGPQGVTQAPVQTGRARFYGQHAGIYEITTPNGDGISVAANLSNPAESDVEPADTLSLAGKQLEAPPQFKVSLTRSIWKYLVLGALLLSAIEWLTYNRRITV